MATKATHTTKKKLGIPEPTLRRLPQLMHYLKQIRKTGIMSISAPRIGKDLILDPTQIVKDLAYTDVTGKPRIGYDINELIDAIEKFLGFDKNREAFLVGAGNLGQALMAFQGTEDFGIKIVAAFDVNKKIINKKFGDITVFHMDRFQELAQQLDVKIGILTTPEGVAQAVADKMAAWGIKGIWNLTPAFLHLPPSVVQQSTSMYSNVAVLLNKLHDSE